MQRNAVDRPLAQFRIEILEQATGGILRRAADRQVVFDRSLAGHDIAYLLAIHQGQRIGKDDPGDAVPCTLRRCRQDHAAARGADEDDVVEVFHLDKFGDFRAMGFGVDAGTHCVRPVSTAIERGGIDAMTLRFQALPHRSPDPAALIGAMQQYECRHRSVSPRLNPLGVSVNILARAATRSGQAGPAP